MMIKIKKILGNLLWLNLLMVQHALAGNHELQKDIISMRCGKNTRVNYNTETGTYDVLAVNKTVIFSAYALVKNGSSDLNSKNYKTRKHEVISLTDGFGKGEKHSFVLTQPGMPEMQQIFYIYPEREYFFTEVLVKGEKLKSSFMAPLVSGKVDIGIKGDNRTLFSPYDNDTFIRYNARSLSNQLTNTSSEIGLVFENNSRKGLVAGSVEHQVWKTGVKSSGIGQSLNEFVVWGGYSEEKVTRDRIPHGAISGEIIKSPKIFVGYFEDWRDGLEHYGKSNRIADKPYVFNWDKPTPFGWNSWGVIQEKITFEKAVAVTDYFAGSLREFRNGNTAYIDLDSFWDNFFKGGLHGDFSKLREFADHCKSKGLEPGVYWAPFTDWGWKSGGDRIAEGSHTKFSDMWTKINGGYHDLDGGRALDPTHPGTQQRVAFVLKKLKACGFKMIKIDFLGHAAIEADAFSDPSITTGMQAFRVGMEHLTDQLDGQMLIYAAISPNLAMGRYAHTRRIACDAWKTIKDTGYTLNSLTYGWWQTYVYNFVDADHIVFGDESIGSNRARLTSGVITGTFITGDDFSSPGPWKKIAEQLLQNPEIISLAKNGVAFKPVEGSSGDAASTLFIREIKGDLYLAVLNYDEKPKVFDIDLNRIGLNSALTYHMHELFQHTDTKAKGTFRVNLPASDASIFKITKK